MDTWQKLEETKLPTARFYNKVNTKGTNDQEYVHGQQDWNRITPEFEDVTLIFTMIFI